MATNDYLKLCLVTHPATRSFNEYQNLVLAAIRGGITSIQLRAKNYSYAQLKALAVALQTVIKPFNIPLIINDDVKLALEIDAAGVHLGAQDMSPIAARKMLGAEKIIGLSLESMEQLHAANHLTCINYVAASAVFRSKTKTNCRMLWGLEGLKILAQNSTHPVIAIGGIDALNAASVIASGAAGIAVVSAIHDALHPDAAATFLKEKIATTLLTRLSHV